MVLDIGKPGTGDAGPVHVSVELKPIGAAC
jgi:hypothetical protein